jgi:hypothetical protein
VAQPLSGPASALSGGTITSESGPHQETVWGLVPDGNPAVTAVLADGTSRTVRVIDNVYSITVTGKVTAIIGKTPRAGAPPSKLPDKASGRHAARGTTAKCRHMHRRVKARQSRTPFS